MFNFFKRSKGSSFNLVAELKKNPNKVFVGESVDSQASVLKDPLIEPHFLFAGCMGSGKSVAATSLVLAHTLANPQDLIIVLDSQKGASDYAPLNQYQRVLFFTNDHRYIHGCIDLLYQELKQRQQLFQNKQAMNINAYNEKNPPLGRIFLVWEEAEVLERELNYAYNEHNPSTAAGKLKTLLRIGRSYGIQLVLVTQVCNQQTIPRSVLVNVSNICAFRINSADANYMGMPAAANIDTNHKGEAETSSGRVKFPYVGLSKMNEYIQEDLKNQQNPLPRLGSINNTGLINLKQNPAMILNASLYSSVTLLDEALVTEDTEFWNFIETGPEILKKS